MANTNTAPALLADLRTALRIAKRVHRLALSAAPVACNPGAVDLDEDEAVEALKMMAELAKLSLGVLTDAGFNNDACLEEAHEFIEIEVASYLTGPVG